MRSNNDSEQAQQRQRTSNAPYQESNGSSFVLLLVFLVQRGNSALTNQQTSVADGDPPGLRTTSPDAIYLFPPNKNANKTYIHVDNLKSYFLPHTGESTHGSLSQ